MYCCAAATASSSFSTSVPTPWALSSLPPAYRYNFSKDEWISTTKTNLAGNEVSDLGCPITRVSTLVLQCRGNIVDMCNFVVLRVDAEDIETLLSLSRSRCNALQELSRESQRSIFGSQRHNHPTLAFPSASTTATYTRAAGFSAK